MLRRFQLAGHRPIALVGGATGMIGDPSGKSSERNLLDLDQIGRNIAGLRAQMERILDFGGTSAARLVNNADWTAPMGCLDFLRDVGKHFPVNVMLQKESVRVRLGSDAGISYTEFSYMLLQAWDFCHLRRAEQCELQIGGTEQWGNITAGIDLIRRKLGAGTTAWGMTFPLLTKADGTKFGKSEGGAVWLDAQRTSPYRLYQFFMQTDDARVGQMLRLFTLLPPAEIETLEAAHAANPGARAAHQALAAEVTTIVHGRTAADDARRASEILFGGEPHGLSEGALEQVLREVPAATAPRSVLDGEGVPLVDLAVSAGLAPSKGQARKDIESGGLYLNGARVTDPTARARSTDLLLGRAILLRKGKRSWAAVTPV
jgi:tyrosyl-tRNA synthetase